MLTRSFFAQRLFSTGGTILWADSATLPSRATVIVYPPMLNSAAAFDGGNGSTTGQSYEPGEHPPR